MVFARIWRSIAAFFVGLPVKSRPNFSAIAGQQLEPMEIFAATRHSLAYYSADRLAVYRALIWKMKPSLISTFLVLLMLLACVEPVLTYGQKHPPAQPLDLNSATVEQLEQVPGIGPKTAQAIVDFRRKSGAFRHVDDLLAIKGISQRKMELMRPYVTVAHPATKPN
jgi:competence ComEA-like helix-hairpin-helix protein